VTGPRLQDDLRGAGLTAGGTVLVHCSLRRVAADADTLRRAIQEVLTPDGTLVVPVHTARNSLSSHRFHAEIANVPAAELPARVAAWEAAIEGFDPDHSPAEDMGRLAEAIRRSPGARRSRHPQTSFAATGRRADEIVAVHDLNCHLGDRSPLGALYAADASVLLIGVGWTACTAFHLAEYRRATTPPERPYRCYVRDADGRRRRLDFIAPDLDDSDFARLGAAFDRTGQVRHATVGAAPTRMFNFRAAVDFAVGWMDVCRGVNPPLTVDSAGREDHEPETRG